MIDNSIVCCYLYPITKYGYPPPAENTPVYLKEMKALGFQSVELEGIRQDHLLDMHEQRYSIRDKLQELQLNVPYFCIVLAELSSTDAEQRSRNLSLFKKGCEIAHLIGAKGVLDNGPLPPYLFPEDIPIVRHFDADVLRMAKFPETLTWSQYWDDLVKTYQRACDIAAEFNLTYLMHPCLGVLSATTDGFLNFYNAVNRENLRFNLDTANQFFMQDNLALSLKRLAGYIDYIHLSDNNGSKVEHLKPGDGAICWDIFFETLKSVQYKGMIGLDIGGAESGIKDIDQAYLEGAEWLTARLNQM